MADRYVVVKGSQSCHCCFDFTVVDTTKPTGYNGQFTIICECFEEADAKIVAEALNRANEY